MADIYRLLSQLRGAPCFFSQKTVGHRRSRACVGRSFQVTTLNAAPRLVRQQLEPSSQPSLGSSDPASEKGRFRRIVVLRR